MPIDTINTDTTPMELDFTGIVISDPSGPRPRGSSLTTGPAVIYDGLPRSKGAPTQIVGAVPMGPCTTTECRTDDECCQSVKVLAQDLATTNADMYFNDASSFLLNFPTWSSTNGVYAAWYLDKLVGGVWVSQAYMNNQLYGTWYNFNTWTAHKSYTGLMVKWWLVLHSFGEGTYRVRLNYGMLGNGSQCFSSEPFCLQTWTCRRANKTVKFESWMGYNIGSKTTEGLNFDLCGMNWYDSIRFRGKFGYEESEYEEKIIKRLDGIVKTTREEMLQTYTLYTGRLQKWLHDRFKTYFHMADELRVCDYNYTNADWNLNRKRIRRNSGYKPDHKHTSRLARVTCQYRERQETVVKSICCETPGAHK